RPQIPLRPVVSAFAVRARRDSRTHAGDCGKATAERASNQSRHDWPCDPTIRTVDNAGRAAFHRGVGLERRFRDVQAALSSPGKGAASLCGTDCARGWTSTVEPDLENRAEFGM